MPHVRIRFLDEAQVAALSAKLLPELSEATGSPVSHFTFEHIPSQNFAGGAAVEADPICEVLWFERPQDVQDNVARLITARLKALAPQKDAVVIFTALVKTAYYENGVHF